MMIFVFFLIDGNKSFILFYYSFYAEMSVIDHYIRKWMLEKLTILREN